MTLTPAQLIQLGIQDRHQGFSQLDNPLFRADHNPQILGVTLAHWQELKESWDEGWQRGAL